uniref:Uncharacterized protein n=1 Tax=Arundo donax TaxID=35708 RepID=A0A0A9G1S1_ARUDO
MVSGFCSVLLAMQQAMMQLSSHVESCFELKMKRKTCGFVLVMGTCCLKYAQCC